MITGFFSISGGEIFIVLLVVFLFFGPDKIPEIARWIGKAVGEVKKATSEIRDELSKETDDIRKQADDIKKDLTLESPLVKKTSDHRTKTAKKDNPDPGKQKREPHL
ncbi:MAG: twin-arginine translocase TatA/TatE family subunit [Bacteroidales bacterium]|nr:twin-arginine translocase TatA/TatE family subunit [Bacteroidales bacterium]